MTLEHWWDTRRQASAVTVFIAALLLPIEIHLVTRPVDGLPRVPLTSESFLTEALAKDYRVSQTMKIPAGGFDILLRASPFGEDPLGEIVLALYEEGPRDREERLLFRDRIHADVALREPTFGFRFPAIDQPIGRQYRLDIWMANGNSNDGVGLWATPGRWSGDGSMFVNEQSAYAELVFETRANSRATVWARVRHHFSGASFVALAMLVAFAHVAFLMTLYSLMTHAFR